MLFRLRQDLSAKPTAIWTKNMTPLIHKPYIEPNKATGRIWVRLCTPNSFLHEYVVDTLTDVDGSLTFAAETVLEGLQNDPTHLTLCYCYCGTTGECLQTLTTVIDDGQPISLLSLGFVPIDHESNMTARTSDETFSSQWSTMGEQRFLIKVMSGGFPSAHENSVARTICQFAKRFQLPVTLLRILSHSGPATHPLESRKTMVDAAVALSDAPRTISRLEQLDEALQLLYDRQVRCRFHVYPDPTTQSEYTPLTTYLHQCFHRNARAITITTTDRSQFVL